MSEKTALPRKKLIADKKRVTCLTQPAGNADNKTKSITKKMRFDLHFSNNLFNMFFMHKNSLLYKNRKTT